MSVVSVQDRRVERVENRRPSEVFLALWRERTISCSPTVDEFAALADTWAQIRELEEIAARERRREERADRIAQLWFPERAETPMPDRVQDPGDPSPVCAPVRDDSEGEGSPSSGADGAPSPQGEGLEPVSESDHPMTEGDGELDPTPAKKPRRSAKEIGAEAFATRKRNILAALAVARADGVSLGDISTGAAGLTLNDVMDILDRKSKPVVTWAALEKALKKLGYPPAAEAGETEAEK